MSDTPTPEPVSPSPETQPTATTTVQTPTSGVIHGSRVDAFRIVAGSTFPVADDALVRFTAGSEPDATTFHVGVTADSVNPHSDTGTDVVIRGTYEDFVTHSADNDTEIVTRVSYQTPYEARAPFTEINNDDDHPFAAEFVSGVLKRWNITADWTDYVLSETLDNDFAVVTRLSTLRDLYDGHPDYTVADAGEYIITDEALVDPDYYETDDPRPEAGHGKGGNPHSIQYHLANGECPVDGCDAEFDRFRELKTHVAGKCAHEPADGPHQDLNLRRHEVTISATTPDTDA